MHILMHCIVIERKSGEGSGEKEKGRRREERWREEREGERELGRNGERRSREGGAGNNFKWLQLFFGVHDLSLDLHTWLQKCKTYKPS